MKTSDFDYNLPPELIAQAPAEQRDASRLLVVHRDTGAMEHTVFHEIGQYIRPGDALVINDTRVIPARLLGNRVPSGGKVEVLLLKRLSVTEWETLVKPGKTARPGTRYTFGEGKLEATVMEVLEDGRYRLAFAYDGVFENILEQVGQTPLPPYITRYEGDRQRYQTVYAREDGSAAAPTAGLHFTAELLDSLRAAGVIVVPVLLHVGLGTFRPVSAENIQEHIMHSESYVLSLESAQTLNTVRQNGGRIIAVGTTSVRVLETCADENGVLHPGAGQTDIFIYPGYRYRATDGLITNFHLPKSTLLMLVSAFAGRELVLRAYETAVEERYRFFSFGDASLWI